MEDVESIITELVPRVIKTWMVFAGVAGVGRVTITPESCRLKGIQLCREVRRVMA
jgi:hypothetical protein